MTEAYREKDIVQWGFDRNIIAGATKLGQYRKSLEELTELLEAIELRDKFLVKDAIGDVYVTLVMQAELWGLSMKECIDIAWYQIKDRKGRMVNGVFVKDE